MRKKFGIQVEMGRLQNHPIVRSRTGDDWGFFEIMREGILIRVLASGGNEEVPWEHVSVSLQTRCPTWDEMCWVKDLFFEEHEVVVQYHPAKAEAVNFHNFCLHMWRPTRAAMPTPPTIAVGPRDAEELKQVSERLGLR